MHLLAPRTLFQPAGTFEKLNVLRIVFKFLSDIHKPLLCVFDPSLVVSDWTRFALVVFILDLFWIVLLMYALFKMFLSLSISYSFDFHRSPWSRLKSLQNRTEPFHQKDFIACVLGRKTVLVALMFFVFWHERIYGITQRKAKINQLKSGSFTGEPQVTMWRPVYLQRMRLQVISLAPVGIFICGTHIFWSHMWLSCGACGCSWFYLPK